MDQLFALVPSNSILFSLKTYILTPKVWKLVIYIMFCDENNILKPEMVAILKYVRHFKIFAWLTVFLKANDLANIHAKFYTCIAKCIIFH